MCFAIYSIVGVLKNMHLEGVLGGVLAAFIIGFGNLIIILFEGMVAMIQGIRLQYYEFFSKFFTETGREFKPFRFTYKG